MHSTDCARAHPYPEHLLRASSAPAGRQTLFGLTACRKLVMMLCGEHRRYAWGAALTCSGLLTELPSAAMMRQGLPSQVGRCSLGEWRSPLMAFQQHARTMVRAACK